MSPNRDQRVRRGVALPSALKEKARSIGFVRRSWTAYRTRQVLREYELRREHYERLARERGLVYSADSTQSAVRARLAARGYTPAKRSRGEVHTFACIPQFGWHKHLLPDLRALGPVTLFDYCAHGFGVPELSGTSSSAARRRDAMFAQLLPAIRTAHARRPIDWIFCYGGGQDTSPVVMREIAETLGIPTANMSLDDKQGWAGESASAWRTGTADITSSFDLYMTSARVACEWHLVEGGRPIYMPEGFDATAYFPIDMPRDLDVSFAGAAYGFRTDVIAFLRAHGVNVATFGAGWPNGWADDLNAVFNRSVINLGMGGIEFAEWLTNVKGRDFELPAAGGGVYLTTFNSDLAQHFKIGEEILCYSSRDEMLELIRYYLRHRDEAAAMAMRARERSLREHRWLHRYERLLQLFGILD
jgi:spore maturation protein CgeB